jgi:glycosyltransferase involved in cell wall biosynthesis
MLKSKIKILWLSDTPHRPSGFGIVSGEICSRLSFLGYEIMMLGWWSAKQSESYAGIPVRRCPERPEYATLQLVKYINHFKPHFVIALGDIPWLSYLTSKPIIDSMTKSGSRLCLYFPIDGVLLDGRIPSEWINILKNVDIPITMSQFGLSAVTRSGIEAIFIPHGCNTSTFAPPICKDTAKERLGYQGKFVILSDARNHRRKLLPRLLDIVKLLRIQKSKFVLHIHTNVDPEEDPDVYRYDLLIDLAQLGLSSVVRLTKFQESQSFLPMVKLAELYAAADVHLLTSYGEGFGLPTLQAASSGVVPMACLHSANTELLGQHGFAITPESSTLDEFGLVRGFIDRERAAAALLTLYNDSNLLRTMSHSARRFAMDYSWETVIIRWDQLLRMSFLRSNCWPSNILAASVDRLDAAKNRAGSERPSGHSAAMLPVPRLGIPLRLNRNQPNRVLVARRLAKRLGVLERLFPGLTVVPCGPIETIDLMKAVQHSLLVVDPERSLHPRGDLACALARISFLGNSPYWPAVARRGLFLQARALLTDMPFAENRANVARERADRTLALKHDQDIPFNAKI